MTPISIIYVTGRKNPLWGWFIYSLYAQTTREQRENLEIIFIDGKLWNSTGVPAGFNEIGFADGGYHDRDRRRLLEMDLSQKFPHVLHIPPLPSAWQGPFRQTSRDYFCAGNQRNTGFVVAKHGYLAFVDDLSVLKQGWFDQVLHAAEGNYCVCGMYAKVKNLSVHIPMVKDFKDYKITYEEYPGGIDSRLTHSSEKGVVPWHGSGMFGCSFGVPLEAALEVDGYDRANDSAGGEDYDFGIRLERAGWPFFLNQNMWTWESEEGHHLDDPLPRLMKRVTTTLPPSYETLPHRVPEKRYDSDHVMLNRVLFEDRTLPLYGSDLRALRLRYEKTGLVPVPAPGQLDWRTGESLALL